MSLELGVKHMTLLICGAGQYGIVAKEVAESMGLFSEIVFLDDHSDAAVGKLDDIENVQYDTAFVAIGNPSVREQMLKRINNPITLVHPNAVVMPSACVGAGSIVESGAVICSNAQVGAGTIVMANAVVGHDARVGACCQLKYNCTVTEGSNVPDKTKIECNTVYHDDIHNG